MLQSHLSSNCLLWPAHKALSDLALARLMFTLPSPWVLIPIPGPLHMPQPGMLSPQPIWISSFRLPKYCCSVPQSCLTLCDPVHCSSPGFPALHCVLEFAQTHVHWVNDTIQPSHPLPPPSPALNLSQNQVIFQWVGYKSTLSTEDYICTPDMLMPSPVETVTYLKVTYFFLFK